MTNWLWIGREAALAIHDRQLAQHGGPAGLRDNGMFEPALARAQNLAVYGNPDAAELAAAYAFGLARNHPFVDGNKRTGWVLTRLFLRLNGVQIAFDPAEATAVMISLAAGECGEEQFAQWLRNHIVRP